MKSAGRLNLSAKPWIWSSDTARILALMESVCSVAVIDGAA